MNLNAFLALANNAALLLSTMLLYEFLPVQSKSEQPARQVLAGAGAGLFGIAIMLTRWEMAPGVYFDARGVLLSILGVYFPPLSVAIASGIMAIFRWQQGGPGALPGVIYIFGAALLGIGLHHLLQKRNLSLRPSLLYGLGLVTHLLMLSLISLLPAPLRLPTLRSVALPILTIFPIATALLGWLLERRKHYQQAQQALKESEARYRLLVEQSPYAIGIHQNGRLVFVNQQAVQLLGGRDSGDLLGRHIKEIVHPEEWEQTIQRVEASLSGEQGLYPTENRYLRLDGSVVPVEVTAAPFQLRGQPAIQVIARDISAEKQARRDMAARLQELEALYEVARSLRTTEDAHQALDITLQMALKAIGAADGAILLYHPESGQIKPHARQGWLKHLDVNLPLPEDGVVHTVFRQQKTIRVADFARLPHCQGKHGKIPAGWGGVCLPLLAGKQAIGVLFISTPSTQPLGTHQVRLLESLAAIAGSTIHRLRLLEERTRRLSQLEALRTIDQAIIGSWELNSIAHVLLEQAQRILQIDSISLWLYDSESRLLSLAANRGLTDWRPGLLRLQPEKDFAGAAMLAGELKISKNPKRPADLPLKSRPRFAAAIPLIAKGEPRGVLEIYHFRPFTPDEDWLTFVHTLAQQAAIAIESTQMFLHLQKSHTELRLAYDETVEGWARALELRDHETEGHTRRVTKATLGLARALGIDNPQALLHIRRGALLHDIGKMGVPDAILRKPGPLTPEERAIIEQHPVWAKKLLEPIAYLRPVLDIPYCHHERWDGSGYPNGLRGEAIPLAARIFAIVDVWDALSTDRPYRRAWPQEKVLAYLQEHAGTLFDPKIVPIFLHLQTEKKAT